MSRAIGAALTERRQRVLTYCDGTMTREEISKAIGISAACVSHDIQALRREGKAINLKGNSGAALKQAQIEKIHQLRAQGVPFPKIAERVGCSQSTAHWYGWVCTRRWTPQKTSFASDVVVYADGGRTTVSHGIGPESARRMALAMARGREVVSHTVEGP